MDLAPEDQVEIDTNILDVLTQKTLAANPKLKLGDRMQSPFEFIKDGKRIASAAGMNPANPPDGKPVFVDSIKILPPYMDSDFILEPERYGAAAYLHPYSYIDNRNAFEGKNVGDDAEVRGIDGKMMVVKLTQDILVNARYVIYRFGVSF